MSLAFTLDGTEQRVCKCTKCGAHYHSLCAGEFERCRTPAGEKAGHPRCSACLLGETLDSRHDVTNSVLIGGGKMNDASILTCSFFFNVMKKFRLAIPYTITVPYLLFTLEKDANFNIKCNDRRLSVFYIHC